MPAKSRIPTLTVIAGPNGAGKTRLSNFLLEKGLFTTSPINIDLLHSEIDKQKISSDILRYESQIKAEVNKIFIEKCKKAIDKGKDFSFETNFSTKRQVDIISYFDEAGYKLNLIYLLLDNVDKCHERVSRRIAEGGHYVSEEDIYRNFTKGLENVDKSFKSWDKVYLIDNTPEIEENATLNVILLMIEGKIALFKDLPYYKVQRYLPKLMQEVKSLQEQITNISKNKGKKGS